MRTFYTPPSKGYVGCVNATGSVVMTLHAGYVEFNRKSAPPDLQESEWPGLGLSTFRPTRQSNAVARGKPAGLPHPTHSAMARRDPVTVHPETGSIRVRRQSHSGLR